VDEALPRILAAVERAKAAVVIAPPGSGKTTRVPPALLARGPLLLLQPRRVAARAIARRIAEEQGLTLGEQVGAYGRHIRGHFAYRKNVTRYDSTTDDFLQVEAGVCQDFTHLMLGLLRLRQIPCRYVSGYLHVEGDEGEVAQSHAWIEFYSPASGWIPFDPTTNREIDERYVVVGHGRHYDDVPPNKGIYRGNADEALEAQVVTRPSIPKAISALYEEMEHIDVPVYPEIPERRRDRGILVIEDQTEQQQQQQQQRPAR
jgi:transglutaminase-like putative cysteine protease